MFFFGFLLDAIIYNFSGNIYYSILASLLLIIFFISAHKINLLKKFLRKLNGFNDLYVYMDHFQFSYGLMPINIFVSKHLDKSLELISPPFKKGVLILNEDFLKKLSKTEKKSLILYALIVNTYESKYLKICSFFIYPFDYLITLNFRFKLINYFVFPFKIILFPFILIKLKFLDQKAFFNQKLLLDKLNLFGLDVYRPCFLKLNTLLRFEKPFKNSKLGEDIFYKRIIELYNYIIGTDAKKFGSRP